MADILIEDALIVTIDTQRRIIRDGAIAIQGDRIIDVGKTTELRRRHTAGRLIHARDMVAMPGFIDTHVHTTEGARGFIPDDIQATPWAREWARELFAVLTPEEEYLLSLLVLAEALKTGTTTVCEAGTVKYVESLAQAAAELGLRCNVGRWTWDLPPLPESLRQTTDQALRSVEEIVRQYHGAANGRISAWVHLLGQGTYSKELIVGAKAIADQYEVGLNMHQSNVLEEVQEFEVQRGKPPIEYLADLGVLGRNVLLVHVVAVNEREVELLREHDVKVVHCVLTCLNLGYGATAIGRFPEMIERGICVSLGCDGANCSSTFDMGRAIYCVAGIYKDRFRDRNYIPAELALEMATINGARGLLMENEIGSIEIGKKADIVLFNTRRPEWLPIINVVNNLVYSADGKSVDTVLVDGRVVVEKGRLTMVDEESLYDRVKSLDWGRLLSERSGLPIKTRWPIV